jgi:hypothetical protein
LNRSERREVVAYIRAENAKYGSAFVQIPSDRWPRHTGGVERIAVWRNRSFLVQAFKEDGGVIRLSVNRSMVDESTMEWLDGITWDELQAIKGGVGYGDREAVEVFPPSGHEVNVANMRHLWVLPEPLPFAWRRRVKRIAAVAEEGA